MNKVHLTIVPMIELCESVSVKMISVRMIRLMKCFNEVKAKTIRENDSPDEVHTIKFPDEVLSMKFPLRSYVNEIMVKKIHIIKFPDEVLSMKLCEDYP